MSDTMTRGIRIQVESEYLEAQSNPAMNRWVHIYHVTITNEGSQAAQLVSRHWIITNARGEQEHVKGPGVVGHQPMLQPGQSFRYTSGCPLDTAVGTMHGTYQMIAEDGERFDAVIAPFDLAEPYAYN
ncbi:MAG: Co2+/Mg2+ efflux protein ApaG [Myxococcota bacterium]